MRPVRKYGTRQVAPGRQDAIRESPLQVIWCRARQGVVELKFVTACCWCRVRGLGWDGGIAAGGGGGHIPQLLRSGEVMEFVQVAQISNFTSQEKTLETCTVANEAKCSSLYPIQIFVAARSCTHSG